MRRTWVALIVLPVLGAGAPALRSANVSASMQSRGAPTMLACKHGTKTVTKKVHGKQTKLKVCKRKPNVTPQPKPTPLPTCPNSEGGSCLGTLVAGTYTTIIFQPQITYTVPSGWANYEDRPGNFLLVPPGFDLQGVNPGTSDFIGIDASVAAWNGCGDEPAPGVDQTVAGMTQWIMTNPGLVDPKSRNVSIGGLKGVVFDLRQSPTWQRTCPFSNGEPVVPLIAGVGPSDLEHVVPLQGVTRLYLLAGPLGVLAIEVVDVHDAGRLDGYSKLVQQLQFKS
jgi:hypothetical protein